MRFQFALWVSVMQDYLLQLPFMYADYDVALSIPSIDSSLLTVPVRNEIALSQTMMDNLIQNKEH